MGGYQSDEDLVAWRKRDPISISHEALKDEIGLDRLIRIDEEATKEIEIAAERALGDPLPTFSLHPASAAYTRAN
jgi:pyruvate dehydrogenase E1 component alpha subunit